MKENIKVFTYWETNKYKKHIPPYILCGIISMKRAFGDKFEMITKHNLEQKVDFDFSQKEFFFAADTDVVKNETSKIVAKSDFLRFKYIQDNGGIWLDCDTIVLQSFLEEISDLFEQNKLVWHSEQFFGSLPENEIISECVNNMLLAERQIFGNPGGCKELIEKNKKNVSIIPQFVWDPTGKAEYNASTWKVATRVDIRIESFIKNDKCSLVKIYNSEIAKMDVSNSTVDEFLMEDSLMAQLFKKIEPNIDYWVNEARILNSKLLSV